MRCHLTALRKVILSLLVYPKPLILPRHLFPGKLVLPLQWELVGETPEDSTSKGGPESGQAARVGTEHSPAHPDPTSPLRKRCSWGGKQAAARSEQTPARPTASLLPELQRGGPGGPGGESLWKEEF